MNANTVCKILTNMESHPLSLAHQQYRRAEAHLRYKRFDEAVQCHHNAAELLVDAMKSTTSSIALESITLQHSYHLKQKDLIKSKKEQYERIKKAMDNLRRMSKDSQADNEVQENSKTQVAIYRNIDKTNSLLNSLVDKKITAQVLNKTDTDSKTAESAHESVIGELQLLGQNLNSLVEQLMMQVEILKDDNITLKEKVDYLENERTKYLNIQSFEMPVQNKYPIIHTNNYKIGNHNIGTEPQVYNAPPARPQQPHFDLSAFKDD